MTTPRTWPTFWARPAICTSRVCSAKRKWRRCRRRWTAWLPHYEPDDGRSWWAAPAGGTAWCVQWFHEHSPTTAALVDDDRFLRIGRLAVDGYASAPKAIGSRPGQTHRRRRGHLRPAVAQGLQSRETLVPVLWADRRHFGDGRRRTIGSARRGRRYPSRPRPACVRPAQLGAARDRPADHHRGRDRAHVVHHAHELRPRRPGAPRHVHRLLPASPGWGRCPKRGGPALPRREQAHRVVSQTPGHVA